MTLSDAISSLFNTDAPVIADFSQRFSAQTLSPNTFDPTAGGSCSR